LWKDLTAGWQWAECKPKIDPEVVETISNVSPGGAISTLLRYYIQSLIKYSLLKVLCRKKEACAIGSERGSMVP
jgi:hypothetical protein